MSSIAVRHNFETGHRLPHLAGKCSSLHGHSWWVEVTFEGELDRETAIVAEYGEVKALVRGWIDEHLDHGLMLGTGDPLRELLAEHGKVYEVAPWPTVEQVAYHLMGVLQDVVWDAGLALWITRVRVQETHVNAAEVTSGDD